MLRCALAVGRRASSSTRFVGAKILESGFIIFFLSYFEGIWREAFLLVGWIESG